MRPTSPLLLGAFAAVALAALAGGAWLAFGPSPLEIEAEEALPLPPEPPRLADGPEMERCLGMLRGDPEGAREFAQRWAEAEGGEGAAQCGALALLALGEPAPAAERLERLGVASRAGPAARAAVFTQAAQAWIMAGEMNRAFAAATLALTLTPDDTDVLVDRAVALGSLGRFAEAVADLDRALRMDPTRADALVFRAAAWRHLDRAEAARRDVERALEITPDSPEALLERGILRQLAGDTEGARMDWERAVELAPNSATADLALQNLALNEAGPSRR
ncbi:tetratricopeptide repeat protein [Falsiroseomonas sp. HW251]|uniref:tetratricopeptide repeat protein n=1 Tax=Falsiroseomonas sp. HW251 TaxID=3390998 RepID=UPI003D3158A1